MANTPQRFLEKIREAKEKQLKELDLSNDWRTDDKEKLTEIPAEVFELEWLEVLSLSGNQLTTLPERSDRPSATTHYPGFKRQPHIGSPLPKTWVRVREALESDSRNYIGLDKYLEICQQNGFTQRNDKLQLSSYLHDLGVCLHFQEDPLLNKTVILKPKWGNDAVYKVLDNEKVIGNLGKFTKSDLVNIWCEDEYTDMHHELLRLMINFKLCYEIRGSQGKQ